MAKKVVSKKKAVAKKVIAKNKVVAKEHTVAEKPKVVVIDNKMKKKQLMFDKKLRTNWQKFLGSEFEFKFGQFQSRAKDNATVKIYDELLQLNNGLLFLEYENTVTGDKFTMYENEWLIVKGEKRVHATDYMKNNLNKLYNKDLELIPQYTD
jgi:hypothetical protein